MKKIVAVIPVRAGSQRVKNKNFKEFCGSNLLKLKIDQIKKLPVDDIIVNTDSEYAIKVAKENNINFFEREKYYASSECSNSEYHEYLAKVTNAENILIAQVTSPLIKENSYLNAINTFYQEKVDSLMSVQKFQNFLIHEDRPLNYSFDNMPNSQNLPVYKIPTFGIVICKKQKMQEYKNYICGKTFYFEVDQVESTDIDTEIDFMIAECLYKNLRLKNAQ